MTVTDYQSCVYLLKDCVCISMFKFRPHPVKLLRANVSLSDLFKRMFLFFCSETLRSVML